LELDWLKRPNIFFLIFLFIFVRVPMLFLGFGLDPDAWRVANSAFDLRYHFVYHTSRFPGYPLPEFIDSLLINFGWTATNSLTMLLSLLSVLTFAYLLKENKTSNKGLLTVTYAFTPLLLINSTNSMDYMWGLSFVIFSWYFIVRRRFIIGGIMMGLAVSARPQVTLFLIPFVFLLGRSDVRKRHIIQFVLASLVISIIAFMPVYMTYGFGFIHHYPPRTTWLQTGYGAIKHFGLPGLVVLILIGVTSLKGFRVMMFKPTKNDLFILLSLIIAFLSFAVTPYHFEYLIPMIPFGLVFISRVAKKPLLILFCCFVLLHGFLTFASIQHAGEGHISIRAVDDGAVIKNITARRKQIADATKITEADVAAHSVILVGPWLPMIAYLGNDISSTEGTKKLYDSNIQEQGVWNFRHQLWYRYLIDLDELTLLLSNNFGAYYVNGVREYTREIYGYDLNDHGAILLEL